MKTPRFILAALIIVSFALATKQDNSYVTFLWPIVRAFAALTSTRATEKRDDESRPVISVVTSGDSANSGAGTLCGVNFIVQVRLLVFQGVPAGNIVFRLRREKTQETYHLTAHLVSQIDREQVYQANWNITRLLGQWSIRLATTRAGLQPQNRLFKIDKREQVVSLARSWSRRGLPSCDQLPNFNACDGFVSYLYQHLGVLLPAPRQSQETLGVLQCATDSVFDNGLGSLHYYFSQHNNNLAARAAHVGVESGAHRIIDNNWGNTGQGPQEHGDTDGVGTFYDPLQVNCSPKDPTAPGHSLLDTL